MATFNPSFDLGRWVEFGFWNWGDSASSARGSHASFPIRRPGSASSPPRNRHELELDFKRYWEEFRSSSSEKEKEAALNLTVDTFCRLVKQHANVAQLVTLAFVTDMEKLKISSKRRSLDVVKVLKYFSEIAEDIISPGANLLTAVEVLISGPVDKQSLLDSGIFCCLIHILNALLDPDEANQREMTASNEEKTDLGEDNTVHGGQGRRLEVEGSVVHIMKALANHLSAAQSLIEDDSLQMLFQMVANGSLTVFSQYKEGLVPLHNIQLHMHVMQIKIILMAVKEYNPNCGDSAIPWG